MRVSRWAVSVVVILFLAGCATTQPAGQTETTGVQGVQEDEQDLIRRGEEAETKLRSQGIVLQDPALQRYVDGVGARLIPRGEPGGVRVRFLILRDPTINAFSLPQGAIGVNTGLLVRLDNEAQLAHVLAHEIVHLVHRHNIRYVRSARKKTVAAKLTQIGALGVGSGLIGLTYAASISGYGREMEQEADLEGMKLAAAAGYDVREVPGLFTKMNEVEEPGALESFFYSDHPTNDARMVYTRQLLQSGAVQHPAGGLVNAKEYRRETAGITVENIRLRLADAHYAFALQEAYAAIDRNPKNPTVLALAGDVHRAMAEDPKGAAREEAMRKRVPLDRIILERHRAAVPAELSDAKQTYLHALAVDPNFALAHRGLGLVAYRSGNKQEARRELGLYLAKGGRVNDRRYIHHLIKEMGR